VANETPFAEWQWRSGLRSYSQDVGVRDGLDGRDDRGLPARAELRVWSRSPAILGNGCVRMAAFRAN